MDPTQFIGPVIKRLVKPFSNRPGDIPVCHTPIIRGGRGWPWNHRLGIHSLPDVKLEITRIP